MRSRGMILPYAKMYVTRGAFLSLSDIPGIQQRRVLAILFRRRTILRNNIARIGLIRTQTRAYVRLFHSHLWRGQRPDAYVSPFPAKGIMMMMMRRRRRWRRRERRRKLNDDDGDVIAMSSVRTLRHFSNSASLEQVGCARRFFRSRLATRARRRVRELSLLLFLRVHLTWHAVNARPFISLSFTLEPFVLLSYSSSLPPVDRIRRIQTRHAFVWILFLCVFFFSY